MFDKAVRIMSTEDIARLMWRIVDLDLGTNYYLKKPSSGWVLADLTNVKFEIIDVKNALISLPVELPTFIKKRYLIKKRLSTQSEQRKEL